MSTVAAPEDGPALSGKERPGRVWGEAIGFWILSAFSISGVVALGLSDNWIAVVKSLALIYLPLGWMFFTRRDFSDYGLQLDRPGQSLRIFAIVSIVTLVPFWSANHLWETAVLGREFSLRIPPGLLALIAGEILAVALPEELFYRGYLQTRLDQVLTKRWRILGANVGWALPLASVIFVAGHMVVRPALWQLGIFFPALVFGWLRVRTGSLAAPILYHALCNLGMLILQDSYS